MKKDREYLQSVIQRRIDNLPSTYEGLYIEGSRDAYDLVLQDIDELEESEVLSHEWIRNNQERKGVHFFVNVTKLQNLLVPKQEFPVIPKYVADFIKVRKHADAYSLQYIFCIAMQRNEAEQFKKEYDWISANDEAFATAWMHGYKVEDEQKYYVDLDTAAYVAKWKDDGQVNIYTDGISGNDKFEFHLTEQEIKNYDERFWPFAKPVE